MSGLRLANFLIDLTFFIHAVGYIACDIINEVGVGLHRFDIFQVDLAYLIHQLEHHLKLFGCDGRCRTSVLNLDDHCVYVMENIVHFSQSDSKVFG